MDATRHRQVYPLETCMFSPHQLHAMEALRLAVQTGLGHLTERGIGLVSMIEDHRIALVVISADVEWAQPFDFFTDTAMAVDSELRLRSDGKVLAFRNRIHAGGQPRVRADLGLRPLRLSGGDAFDATPWRLQGALRDQFTDAELEPELPSRSLERELGRWSDGAEVLGRISEPFRVRRTDCEFADQWKFTHLPAILGHARDSLGLGGGGALSYGLSRPLRRFRSEWWRPMYLGAEGRVDLQVLRDPEHADRVHFVYHVLAIDPAGAEGRVCAMAVETY